MSDHHKIWTGNLLFKDQSSYIKSNLNGYRFHNNHQNYIRIADSIIDPSVAADPLVHRHCVISTSLHMNEEQHVYHSLDNPKKKKIYWLKIRICDKINHYFKLQQENKSQVHTLEYEPISRPDRSAQKTPRKSESVKWRSKTN